MKTFIRLAAILLLLGMAGCKKYLELAPKNQRTIVSAKDIETLLASYLKGTTESFIKPLYGEVIPACPVPALLLFEAYSDNIDFEKALPACYLQPNNLFMPMEKDYADLLLWNQYNTPELLWKQHYEIIGFMNSLIDQLEDLPNVTQQERDIYSGEMHAHRAYSLFKLLQYFAPYDHADMGIPVYLHTGRGVLGISVPRKTHAEVYQIILEDLGKAMEMINRTPPRQNYSVFYNKRFLHHILAQVYWFKAESPAKETGDYAAMKTACEAALENVDATIPVTAANRLLAYSRQLAGYPVVVQVDGNQGALSPLYGTQYNWLLPGLYKPNDVPLSEEFSALFKSTDIRIGNYFNTDPTRSGGKVWPQATIINWAWPSDGTIDGMFKQGTVCLFKPEEAYLMLAEAQYRLDAPGDAVTTLNKFKTFRNAGTVAQTAGEGLLQEIIDERRREFFADTDKRWLDLKRYGKKTITRSLTFFNKKYDITVSPNDYRYALPIPLAEVQENNDMIPNPGWEVIQY